MRSMTLGENDTDIDEFATNNIKSIGAVDNSCVDVDIERELVAWQKYRWQFFIKGKYARKLGAVYQFNRLILYDIRGNISIKGKKVDCGRLLFFSTPQSHLKMLDNYDRLELIEEVVEPIITRRIYSIANDDEI